MVLETIATPTALAAGVDIVCSAWRHAAASFGKRGGEECCDSSRTQGLGFPMVNKGSNKAAYVPMETFPIEGDEVPDGYEGWLLFLDELPLADRAVQKAAYKLILDKMVGNYRLHKKVAIVAAGNLETDNAMVEEMSTALQSRLIHMIMETDVKQWIEWATTNEIDYRITSYIQWAPNNLYNFRPDHVDNTYASPRTWEFVSRLLNLVEPDNDDSMPLIAGTIGQGVAREFLGFLAIYKSLPTLNQLLRTPESIQISPEPDVLFALTGFIANHVDKDNLAQMMKFVARLPMEFQVVCLREMIRRKRDIKDTPEVDAWINKNSNELY